MGQHVPLAAAPRPPNPCPRPKPPTPSPPPSSHHNPLYLYPHAQVRAAYAEKYPEEYAEFESIMTGKLPANWAEKLPKFTAEGEEEDCRQEGM